MSSEYDKYAPLHTFDDSLVLDFRLDQEEIEQLILNQISNAKVVVDLGSGWGNSTKGLLSLIKAPEKIYTVDGYVEVAPINTKESDVEHTHYYGEIVDFLAQQSVQADLALLRAVPRHRLSQNNGYQRLSNTIRPGGLVIELGDTALDASQMTECGFELVATLDESASQSGRIDTRNAIWRKTEIK